MSDDEFTDPDSLTDSNQNNSVDPTGWALLALILCVLAFIVFAIMGQFDTALHLFYASVGICIGMAALSALRGVVL